MELIKKIESRVQCLLDQNKQDVKGARERKWGIRNQLIALLLLITIVPLTVVGLFIDSNIRSAAQADFVKATSRESVRSIMRSPCFSME